MAIEYVPMLHRSPPGDRWEIDGVIHESLTEGLNAVFLKTKCTTFLVDAKQGIVSVSIETDDIPPPPKRFSLYDEA